MDSLNLEAERALAALLAPDEPPLEIIRTSYDRTGGVGDGYVVLTGRRLFVGDRPLSGAVSFREYGLVAVRGVELHDESFSKGTASFVGESGTLDQIVYSGFEKERLAALPALLAARAPHRPPAFAPTDPLAPMDPLAAIPVASLAGAAGAPENLAPAPRDEPVPMAVIVDGGPHRSPARPGKKSLALRLDRAEYFPGDTVQGRITLNWPATGEVRGIWMDATGAERTRISVTKGSGKHRRTVTYTEERALLRHGRILFGARKTGFFGRMGEGIKAFFGMKTDNPALEAGEYSYDFAFPLDGDVPPGHDGTHAKVAYELFVRVDIPGALDLEARAAIPVVNPPVRWVEGWDRTHRPKTGFAGLFTAEVEMEVELAGTRFQAGETLPVTLYVKNLGGKRIRGIVLALDHVEWARAHGHTRTTALASTTARFEGERLHFDGSPNALAIRTPKPLVHYEGRHSRVWYSLRAELDIAWGFDAKVEGPLPIVAEG